MVTPPSFLQCCNQHLQCSDIAEELMVQSLCAMVLLEGCSPRQVFAKFLLARKVSCATNLVEGKIPMMLQSSVESKSALTEKP